MEMGEYELAEYLCGRSDAYAVLVGGGEMGRRIRAFDWSSTSLKSLDQWPQTLSSSLSICLNSNFPIAIYWGPDLVLLYNDEWSSILGEKHSWALGRPAREAWPEIWHIIEPLFLQVLETGTATRCRDQLLPMHRHGFTEECYFDYTFSPIRGERGRVEGIFNAVLETTQRVIGERRLRTLRELGAATTGDVGTMEDACRTAARILGENPYDLPFALIYLLDEGEGTAKLVGASGVPRVSIDASLQQISLTDETAPWPLRRVIETGQPVELSHLPETLELLSGGAWPESPHQAVILPMAKSGSLQSSGIIVAGVSPRLALDDEYRGFFDLLTSHVGASVASASAYQDERRRAESLAELDRAKTTFFSNVSHEFRTPLTLMLGPVEDLLSDTSKLRSDEEQRQLELVHRNGLRLQRLVNTLLDFSRIEAGRLRASYEPTDLSAFTADLASNFRSACERANLDLVVDCQPLDQPAYVDRTMWEKIVLNLVSNAFKFTFSGSIRVTLRQHEQTAVLEVSDTGIGIAAEEMPHLFDRFHRIENVRGRTHEGSGIGLALVQELVRLHGGSIRVSSEAGQGATFLVHLPLGFAHLPTEQLKANTATEALSASGSSFVDEALRWLPDTIDDFPAHREVLASTPLPNVGLTATTDALLPSSSAYLLIADDNADMRQYLARLLGSHYRVTTVTDGEEALAAVREERPDLILSDVMMPRIDGFELIRKLRTDSQTASVPVILLSARAGEECRVDGMEAGADDYLVKPFSARELLARVSAHLQMARLRNDARESLRASEERFQSFMDHSPTMAYIKDAEGRYLFVNRMMETKSRRPLSDWIGKTDFDLYSLEEATEIRRNDASVLQSGETAQFFETNFQADGIHHLLVFKFPLAHTQGHPLLGGVSLDITDQKQAIEAQQKLAAIVESSHDAIFSIDLNGTISSWNRGAVTLYGYQPDEVIGKPISILVPPDHTEDTAAMIEQLRQGKTIKHFETIRVAKHGTLIEVSLSVSPVLDAEGRVVGASKIARDITERKRAEEAIRRSEERLAAELEATTRLHALSSRLLSSDDLIPALEDVLENAIATCGANSGNIQLLNPHSGALEIVAHQGVGPVFCEHFRSVRPDNGTACARAIRSGQRVVIEDVEQDAPFAPHRPIARIEGFRAVQSTPLKTHTGSIVGTLATQFSQPHRITDRDERLLDLYARHAADFIERLQYEQALRDADRRKDEFLATLAHELRNPLAPLRNGLQLIKLAKDNPDASELARGMMERQLAQMVHLIDDLLDLSRISRGKIELRKQQVELASVLQQAIETSRPAIDQAQHELHIEMPSAPIHVDADITRLAQVFSNLLNNAAKYTDPGGTIRLSVHTSDANVQVIVSDTGVGIPGEMLPHVFEMFTQVDRHLARSQGGLGIGLSIVKRLVEMHNGRVEARSEGQGRGSAFLVDLPISTSDVTSEPLATPTQTITSHFCRVLVVDDNRDAASSLALMLSLMGKEARIAHDGKEAFDVAADFKPDLILLDIGMPHLNGYDTARQIRNKSWGKRMVLVALTGWGQEEDRRRSHDAGFDLHLTKPIDPATLDRLLADLQAGGPQGA